MFNLFLDGGLILTEVPVFYCTSDSYPFPKEGPGPTAFGGHSGKVRYFHQDMVEENHVWKGAPGMGFRDREARLRSLNYRLSLDAYRYLLHAFVACCARKSKLN